MHCSKGKLFIVFGYNEITMTTVGIIGFGHFGKFLAEKLSPHAKVFVYSPNGDAGSWAASLQKVAACEFVIPAIPLQSYEAALTNITPHLRSTATIVDVCSVKVTPLRTIRQLLPGQPVVATHPMFGPESASSSLSGHTIVMCPDGSSVEQYARVKEFVRALGLNVKEMTLEEHDREIAVVQGLTFFVARTLEVMGIHDQQLHTPSFGRLLSLAELEKHHSQELFETIQLGNVSSAEVREKFIKTARHIDVALRKK